MSFALYPTLPYLDGGLSTIKADVLNTWRTYHSRALDGVGGSAGIESSLATALILGGAGLEMRGPLVIGGAVDFDVDNTAPEINQDAVAGTGATAGVDLAIHAQPGQAQTGVAANNDGGDIVHYPGAPGTGGSGAAGQYGDDVVAFNDRQYTRYAEVSGVATSATQTIRTVTLATGAVATIEVRCQNKGSGGLGGSHVIMGSFRNIAGTTQQQGSTTAIHTGNGNTGAAVAFDVSGANVEIDVTAGSTAATTTSFNAFITVSEFTP